MPILKVDLNNGTTFRFDIEGSEATMGRTSECEIMVENAFISKKHALFKMVAPGVYEIIDLGGKNGTYVNGARVQRHTLRHEDQIHFGGQVKATYLAESAAHEASKAEARGEKVVPAIRKLGADAFDGAGETSPLDPDEFTSTQEVTSQADADSVVEDPLTMMEAIIRRARDGEDGESLLEDLEKVRDLLG